MRFRDDFVWGVATASYQIEGAAAEDGRKPSVWDMLTRKSGTVFEGHTGDIACDHYHRYKEDVALMRELGLDGYRFSFAWPRILPEGTGDVNEKGLDFYDRLVDELLKAGIAPWATLYHWDLPMALYHRGGWLNPDSPKWFADYTQVVVERLSDRVTNWMTLNEPQCFIGLGMKDGVHAPGVKLSFSDMLLAAHHSLVAHGLGVQAIRAGAKSQPKIGFAPVCDVFMPATDSPADIEAARKATWAVKESDQWQASWWMDPVFFGKYPEDGLKLFGANVPEFPDEDLKTIQQPLDFCGLNLYHGKVVQAEGDGWKQVQNLEGRPMTAFRWPVTPNCLYWASKFYFDRYGKPVVITENGLANQDWVALDGKVHDPTRIDFLQRHLLELRKASAEGIPVNGYFQWSLMDNFEWAEGYSQRFGLVYVDYQTLKRIPKDSFYWYQQVIRSNGESLG